MDERNEGQEATGNESATSEPSVNCKPILGGDTVVAYACCRYCTKRHSIHQKQTHDGKIRSFHLEGEEGPGRWEMEQMEQPEKSLEKRVDELGRLLLDITKVVGDLKQDSQKWKDHDHLNGRVMVPSKKPFEL